MRRRSSEESSQADIESQGTRVEPIRERDLPHPASEKKGNREMDRMAVEFKH